MEYTVSDGVVAALSAELAFVVLLPVLLLVRWRKRTGGSLISPLVGMIIFLVFAQMLEQILHFACLISDNPLSRAINVHPILYAVYSGLAAGLFEETGRFMGFKYMLRQQHSRQTAIGYGIGHGGYECLAVVGMATLSELILALFLKNGMASLLMEELSGAEAEVVQIVLEQVSAITPSMCLWGALERAAAIVLQISLSILVFTSVWQPEHGNYYLFAVVLHTVANLPAGCYQSGLLTGSGGIVAAELLTFAVTLVAAYLAYRVWKTLPEELPPASEPPAV